MRKVINELIKNSITKSGNEYLFAIPYTPKTNNPIEAYFNQIKTYMKKNINVLQENFFIMFKNKKIRFVLLCGHMHPCP